LYILTILPNEHIKTSTKLHLCSQHSSNKTAKFRGLANWSECRKPRGKYHIAVAYTRLGPVRKFDHAENWERKTESPGIGKVDRSTLLQ